MGFGATFSRVLSYAYGGAEKIEDLRNVELTSSRSSNWTLVERITNVMYTIYRRLSAAAFLLLVVIGTVVVSRTIENSSSPQQSWVAWIIIIFSTTLTFYGLIYNNFLFGLNKVALLRRWEAITGFGAILTNAIVLFTTSSLLALVISNQSWLLINVLRNRWLCRRIENGKFKEFSINKNYDRQILKIIWPKVWRSGIGYISSYGAIQLSGIIYAQIGTTASVASYLLALRIIESIKAFAQAPFYSKIPLLSRLRSEGKITEQVKVARLGMFLAHSTFVLLFIFTGLFSDELFRMIRSNADFVDPLMWNLLGLAFFIERYGAMHLQLYSTTNHIIWHIANGFSGIVYLIVSLILLNVVGLYSFPIGIIAGYLGFYSWYSAYHSYKVINEKFLSFEIKVTLLPLILLILYIILSTTTYLK